MENVEKSEQTGVDSQFVPPDGGWGYIVTLSYILFNYATIVFIVQFGLLYGPFLESIGNETSGTSLTCSTFIAVMSFTGFATSFLLRRYGSRVVGLVGATSYSLGSVLEIFGTNLTHMILCYGVLRAFGYGLMLSSSLTSMNDHFKKKHSLMMGVSMTVSSVGTIISPLIIDYMMKNLGFRKTLLLRWRMELVTRPIQNTWLMTIVVDANTPKKKKKKKKTLGVLAGISLINFPAMATYRPVNRYMKLQSPDASKVLVTKIPPSADRSKSQIEPLLQPNLENKMALVKPNSIPLRENRRLWSFSILKDWLLDTIGLRLLRDLKYVNMAVGLSLPYVTECMFLLLIRMFLNNLKFESSDIALMMTIHFSFDVISKIIYSALSGIYAINNRGMFLVASFLTAIFRIVFILVEGRTWKMVIIAMVGLLKGIQEVPSQLVVSDMYKNNFSTAYSLYMVVQGCIFFIIAALTSYVRDLTQSDSMIIYLLAVANFITCFSWIMEYVFIKLSEKKSEHGLSCS